MMICSQHHSHSGRPETGQVPQIKNSCLFGFRVISIPLIQNDGSPTFKEEVYRRHVYQQAAFLDTIPAHFINTGEIDDVFTEMRFMGRESSRSVHCYLLVHLTSQQPLTPDQRNIYLGHLRQILVPAYGYLEIDESSLAQLLAVPAGGAFGEIAKAAALIKIGHPFNQAAQMLPPIGVDTGQYLASRSEPMSRQTADYVVAASAYAETDCYFFHSVIQVISDCDESLQVRVSFTPSKLSEMDIYLAMTYRTLLIDELARTGNPVLANFLKTYQKLVNNPNLYAVKLQLQGKSESAVRLAATTIISAWRTTAIRAPGGDYSPINYLSYQSLTGLAISPAILAEEWNTFVQRDHILLHEWYTGLDGLASTPAYSNPEVQSFIARLPYLCDTREASHLWGMPLSFDEGLPGLPARPVRPFYLPYLSDRPQVRQLQIGKILSLPHRDMKLLQPASYSLALDDIPRHGLICGITGSGKSTTMTKILEQIIGQDVPFLLIEPVKSEYYRTLSELVERKGSALHHFEFSSPWLADGTMNPAFLRFNPLMPEDGVSMHRHMSYIKSCIATAFAMDGILLSVFEKMLDAFYLDEICNGSKYYYFFPGRSRQDIAHYRDLDLNDFFVFSSGYITDRRGPDGEFSGNAGAEIAKALKRRFEKLSSGIFGQIFCRREWTDAQGCWQGYPNRISELLNENAVIELDHLPDNEDKALLMGILLTYLFEDRQKRKSHERTTDGKLKGLHLTVIEEAHRLFSNKSSARSAYNPAETGVSKSISIFIDMLAEIRAKNEGIFVVEQIPQQLTPEVIKNTNFKLMHKLGDGEEREMMGKSMNLSVEQIRFCAALEPGQAVVSDNNLTAPILIHIDNYKAHDDR